MKKILIVSLAVWIILIINLPAAYAEESQMYSLTIDVDPAVVKVYGETIDAPAPFVTNVIWVPFRAIAEAYNYRVEWGGDPLFNCGEWDENSVIYINNQGLAASIAIDGINAVVVDGRTFVPYEYITSLNFEDNNIVSRLGYSKEYLTAIQDDKKIFGKYFTEPPEDMNLRYITRGLSYPFWYRYRTYDVRTDPINEISVLYDDDYDNAYPGGNGLNPFYDTINENNALILFAVIEGLDRVNFLFYVDGDLNHTASYDRKSLSERFGDINPQDMDAAELYKAIYLNFQTSEWYFAHYSRIYLGASFEDVAYRNAEPDEIVTRPDSSVIWIYEELGKSYTAPSPDGQENYGDQENNGDQIDHRGREDTGGREINDPGYTAYYYFNYPPAIANDGLTGLYATKFTVADGETYLKIVSYLGFPSFEKDMGGGCKFMAYQLRDGQKRNAYYIMQNNIEIANGVIYGDDYKILF